MIRDVSQWACDAAMYYSAIQIGRNAPQEVKSSIEEGTVRILGLLREHRIKYERYANGTAECTFTEFGEIGASYKNPILEAFIDFEARRERDACKRSEKREKYLRAFKTDQQLAGALALKLDEIIKTHDRIAQNPAKAEKAEIQKQKEYFLELSRWILAYRRSRGFRRGLAA